MLAWLEMVLPPNSLFFFKFGPLGIAVASLSTCQKADDSLSSKCSMFLYGPRCRLLFEITESGESPVGNHSDGCFKNRLPPDSSMGLQNIRIHILGVFINVCLHKIGCSFFKVCLIRIIVYRNLC